MTSVIIEIKEGCAVTGSDLGDLIEKARKAIVYNMGPDVVYSASGAIYERGKSGGKKVGEWRVAP